MKSTSRPDELVANHDVVCYTDGSLVDTGLSGAGLSMSIEGDSLDRSYSLGRYTSVFQAEVFAILQAALLSEEAKLSDKRIVICSDSQAALGALGAACCKSAVVRDCQDALCRVARCNSVSLLWVPGHSNVPGNEMADSLARRGSSLAYFGPEPAIGVPPKAVRRHIDAAMARLHGQTWENNPGCRGTKRFAPLPRKKVSTHLLALRRDTLRQVIGVITGHFFFNRHLALLGLVEEAACEVCGEQLDTATHFVGDCPGYDLLRLQLLGADRLAVEELSQVPIKDLTRFVKASHKFYF